MPQMLRTRCGTVQEKPVAARARKAKICVDGSTFTGVFSAALDLAIQNYNELALRFAMARMPSAGCGFDDLAAILGTSVNGA